MRGVDDTALSIGSTPAATVSRPDDRLSEAFGVHFYQWGAPPYNALSPSHSHDPTSRRALGADVTLRIKDGESNHDFEIRVDQDARGYLHGETAQWVDGEMRFKNHRYTEAILHIRHLPINSPVRPCKVLTNNN